MRLRKTVTQRATVQTFKSKHSSMRQLIVFEFNQDFHTVLEVFLEGRLWIIITQTYRYLNPVPAVSEAVTVRVV